MQSMKREHAIVMGGSMAGLLAARVLSGYFERVTIVDRDSLPSSACQRRGVPQGRHTHGLLAGGGRAIEKFFPGITEALANGGAVAGDVARESRWFFEGGRLSGTSSGLQGLLLSRPMIEAGVRERVLALKNVTVRGNGAVEMLTVEDEGSRVSGVQIDNELMAADLVVDATGRQSRTPKWLERLGYTKPPEEEVYVALAYTTRLFKRRPGDLGGDMAVVIPPTPEGKCGGVMLAQESERWTVTLIGHFGKHAPEDLDGFLEFARALPAPYIYEAIHNAEPLGEAAGARFPASVRRRYESLKRFPESYLVIGDAVCSFNPIYGQGMSVAALEAAELDATLAAGTEQLARRYFARIAKIVDTPWQIAVGNDLRMKETRGPRSAAVSFVNWYISRLHKAAHTDPTLTVAFLEVNNLVAPPAKLFHPRILLRVLRPQRRPAVLAGNQRLQQS